MQGEHRDGVLFSAELTIEPELPPEVLDRVRPSSEPSGVPSLAWLDAVKTDPTGALEQFVDAWIPESADDVNEFRSNGRNVPTPLAEFYALARHRPTLLGRQNHIRRPDAWIEAHDGLVAFGDENQGGFVWLFDPSQDDPDVWIDQDGHELRCEHEPMAGFLLQFALHETMLDTHLMAVGTDLGAEHVAATTDVLTPVPWEPWRWPNDSTRFFVAPGLIAVVTDNRSGGFSVRVGAAHRSVLRPLGQLGVPWSTFDA